MRNKNRFVSLCYGALATMGLLYGATASATIVDDLQPERWLEIPNTRLEVLNPCPGDDCEYSAPIQGFFGIMDGWSGGTYDTIQNRLLIWGGGHQSYYGNDMYAFDLDTLNWSQVIEPSNYSATTSHEDAGQYPDGRPVARHTYNSLVFLESQNAFMAAGAYAQSPTGASGDARFWKLDFDNSNLEWTRASDGDSNGNLFLGYAAYNKVTDTVYYHRSGGGRLYKYNPNTDTHTFLTQKAVHSYATPAIDTSRNKMLVLGGRNPQAMVWDLNTATPTLTDLLDVSAFTNSSGNELANESQFGVGYDEQNDQYVAWKGGNTVYYINPVTFQVTKSDLPGDNPGAQSQNGTYGRFQYSASIGGFVVVNAIDQNVHVFKTSAEGVEPGPIVNFTTSNETINIGGSITLNWSATNATGCVASGDWSGSFDASGSQTIDNITTDRNFVITCSGDGGDTTQTVNVMVNEEPPPPPLPGVNFSASNVSVIIGGNVNLTWSSTNANSCQASGDWSGTLGTSGTQTISNLQEDSTFTITCTGDGGSRTSTVLVDVRATAAEPVVQFNASSTSVSLGDAISLTWSSTNASSCQASGDWSGSLAANGQQTISNLQEDSTFTITCIGDGGGADSSVQVTVQTPRPVIEFESSSTSVVTGTTIRLTWSSTYATSCQATGDWSGSLAASGQQAVTNLLEPSTFTLTCSGDGGTSSETIQVNVTTQTQPPVLEFNVSPLALGPVGTVVLIWNSPNSNTCTAGGSWSGARTIAGIRIVGPIANSETYNITCSNNIGIIEDSITVSYEDSDSDGMADIWETALFGSLQNSGNNDSDSDGLIDRDEYVAGTDPGRDDTDGDGQTDGEEVAGGSDPRDSSSVSGNTSPNQPAVDDNNKADLTSFELDTTNGYVDPDGNPLNYSQWQIALDQDYTSIMFDRSAVGTTSMMVPVGVLEPSETYYLRTRHFDSSNTPSAWSETATLVADVQFPNDADGNYINDTYQVPGNPDSNNNGVPDQNEGICNLYDAEGGNVIGLTSNLGTTTCYTSVPNSVAANGDLASGSEVPLGMFSFRVEGLQVNPTNPASVDVTVYLPNTYATDSGWQKYDEATGEFSDYSANVTFSGTTAVVRLVDGGFGDQDGVVNGIIIDPSGPVIAEAPAPPPPPPPPPPPGPDPDAGGSSSGGGSLGLLGLAFLLGVGRRRALVESGNRRL